MRKRPGNEIFRQAVFRCNQENRAVNDLTSGFSTLTLKHMLRVWSDYQFSSDWNRVSTGLGSDPQSVRQ